MNTYTEDFVSSGLARTTCPTCREVFYWALYGYAIKISCAHCRQWMTATPTPRGRRGLVVTTQAIPAPSPFRQEMTG